MKLKIKVKPSSKTDEVMREADGSWKIKIKAPPIDGKANKYLLGFLSTIFELPKSKIVLRKGETNSFKTVEIEAEEDYIIRKLQAKIAE